MEWVLTATKSDTFFVVSNFNHDPIPMCNYAKNFVVYDQSNKPEYVNYLKKLSDSRIKFSKHVGHNILDYLNWILENWDSMPDVVCFTKGNAIGRHIDLIHWERIYKNQHYTFIYNDCKLIDQNGIQFATNSSDFHEINNSWFVSQSTHRYFNDTNQLLQFLYKDARNPPYLNFSPGACYIVESSRIKNKPIIFWACLKKILEYEFFPSEAWMVERILHLAFTFEGELNTYLYDMDAMLEEVEKIPDRTNQLTYTKPRWKKFASKVYWKTKSHLNQ